MTDDSQASLYDSFPPISDKLIRALQRAFPDRSPTLGTPEAQLWYNAGQSQIAGFLEAVQAHQRDGEHTKENN